MSTVTVKWTLPTTRLDGSPLAASDIAGSQIFDATSPTPLVPIGTVTGAATEFTTDTETVGTHNFTVEVTDTGGHQSGMSNVASVDVPAVVANPSPPIDVTATLNP